MRVVLQHAQHEVVDTVHRFQIGGRLVRPDHVRAEDARHVELGHEIRFVVPGDFDQERQQEEKQLTIRAWYRLEQFRHLR